MIARFAKTQASLERAGAAIITAMQTIEANGMMIVDRVEAEHRDPTAEESKQLRVMTETLEGLRQKLAEVNGALKAHTAEMIGATAAISARN